MSTLSTHVLDTASGRPAAGVRVTLERAGRDPAGGARLLAAGETGADGRWRPRLEPGDSLGAGVHVLRFDVAGYFALTERATFYTEVEVRFVLGDADEHYHVPLLVSPFGYSTYRGS